MGSISGPAPGGGKRWNTSNINYDPYTDMSRARIWDYIEDPSRTPTAFAPVSNRGDVNYGQLSGIIGGLTSMGNDPTPTEQRGLNEFQKATDLGAMTNAYKNYFSQIATPQIRNSLALTGNNRGGAEGEAVANAGVQAAVPLTTLQNQRQAEYGQLMTGVGGSAADRQIRAMLGGGELELGFQKLMGDLGIQDDNQKLQFMSILFNMMKPVQTGGNFTDTQFGVGGQYGGQASASFMGGGGGGAMA